MIYYAIYIHIYIYIYINNTCTSHAVQHCVFADRPDVVVIDIHDVEMRNKCGTM